jgi:hypothetical protein
VTAVTDLLGMVLPSLPNISTPNDEEKTPSSYALGVHTTQTLLDRAIGAIGGRGSRPVTSAGVSAGPRECNADHGLV